jgi:two-component system, chemotaxis family, CheB/CheR fusion protein
MPTLNKKTRKPKGPAKAEQPIREQPRPRSLGLASQRASFPIVAVGASAGGLEAFSALLRALPPQPGLALIFIPHLDPTHESAMVELLARTTRLPVHQAAEGMSVAPNAVYVIPPHSDMTITDGVLHLVRRGSGREQHMPVDIFCRSLAEDQGSNSVGVILSGTASDGTLGLLAIKDNGGITFAQDSESAKYDGMPQSASAAGGVDFVLPPARIAYELTRIREQPSEQQAGKDAFDGKDRLMKEVFRLLKKVSKVDFIDYKEGTVRRRIMRRMNVRHLEDLGDYVQLLLHDPQEIEALYRDLLINVTRFFRNPEAFAALREIVYPTVLTNRSSSDPIRLWVPGCSTGEEIYSHAISLVETLSDMHLEIPVQIFGTDLSEGAIRVAREGIYKESVVAELSEVRLRRFFHKTEGGYQISKTIRDMCVFARQNVFSDPPFSRMDLISCRNVLIYLSPVLQKKVIPIFHYALKPARFLLVGNSEGLLGSGSELFELVDRKNKIYQKKAVASGVNFGFSVGSIERPEQEQDKPIRAGKQEPPPPKPPTDVQREADRLLLTRYVPSAVVVSDDLEIVQSRGRTNRFLELPTGKASLNLLKMARPGLLYELRSLIEKARKTQVPVTKDGVVLEDSNGGSVVRIEVIPFRTPAHDQRHFLVLFEGQPTSKTPAPAKSVSRRAAKANSDLKEVQIAQLKQELASTKEYLQSIIESQEASNEELQSANEEIQSGNEELQSTNEELQTSKEELESANEELNTVNEEIQNRNQQLAQLSNDLVNLLKSATIPMIMLGEDLHIRRYTAEAERIFGFSEEDVGKALTRLPLNLELPRLQQWMLDVMRDVAMRNEQIEARDGKVYKLRISPYRTLENKIDGVVLVLLDITDVVNRGSGDGSGNANGDD